MCHRSQVPRAQERQIWGQKGSSKEMIKGEKPTQINLFFLGLGIAYEFKAIISYLDSWAPFQVVLIVFQFVAQFHFYKPALRWNHFNVGIWQHLSLVFRSNRGLISAFSRVFLISTTHLKLCLHLYMCVQYASMYIKCRCI